MISVYAVNKVGRRKLLGVWHARYFVIRYARHIFSTRNTVYECIEAMSDNHHNGHSLRALIFKVHAYLKIVICGYETCATQVVCVRM